MRKGCPSGRLPLKISQSTTHRAVLRVRLWMGATLPEERGDLREYQQFRAAVVEHELLLRKLLRRKPQGI